MDVYTWAAIYTDGSFISEYDRPEGRGFAEVDSTRVKQFKLESSDPALHSHHVDVPEGAQAVFFRRRRISVNVVSEASEPRPTVHCIGWKRGEDAVYLFVDESGNTILSYDLQAG